MATAMPPLAEPSSFVSATPVTPTASLKRRACCTPFWPVVASTTSSVSCGAPSSLLAITRRTFASSSIRFVCVCRRPAVSTMTTSRPRDCAASSASYATAAGSPPRSPPTKSAPARSAQISSCSSAAARNVSAAPSTTERPCSRRRCASLPIVVVLPVPLTPTTRITLGGPSRPSRPGSPRRAAASSTSASLRSPSSPLASRRRTSSAVEGTPTSAAINTSSSRSQAASSAGSNVAAAICSVRARRPLPSDSRRREEEGEEKRDRTKRLLAAREKRELGHALAGRAQLDLDPWLRTVVGTVLVRLAQPQTALAAGEERLGDVGEVPLHGGERLLEAALDRLGQLLPQLLQLREAPLEVLALGRELGQPLLLFLVLLLGKGVHSAERLAPALEAREPLGEGVGVVPLSRCRAGPLESPARRRLLGLQPRHLDVNRRRPLADLGGAATELGLARRKLTQGTGRVAGSRATRVDACA